MKLNIEVKDISEIIIFDTDDIHNISQFEGILDIFTHHTVSDSQKLRVAMIYYENNYEDRFIKIIGGMAERDESGKICAIYDAYMLQNNMELKYYDQKSVFDIIKGIVSLKGKDLSSAKKFFRMCVSNLGIELVSFEENERNVYENRMLRVLNEYVNGNSATINTCRDINPVLRFRIDFKFRYRIYEFVFLKELNDWFIFGDFTEDENTGAEDIYKWKMIDLDKFYTSTDDVKYTITKQTMKDGVLIENEFRKILEGLKTMVEFLKGGLIDTKQIELINLDVSTTFINDIINKFLLIDTDKIADLINLLGDCSEKFFLLGKINHIEGKTNEAVSYYSKSKSFLAKYNHSRILTAEYVEFFSLWPPASKIESAVVFQCFLANKFGEKRIDCELQEVYDAIKQRNVHTFRKILKNKFVDEWMVLNNLAFSLWFEIDAYRTNDPSFKPIEVADKNSLFQYNVSEMFIDVKNEGKSQDNTCYEINGTEKNGTTEFENSNGEKCVENASAEGDNAINKTNELILSMDERMPNFLNFFEKIEEQRKQAVSLLEKAWTLAPEDHKDTIIENITAVSAADDELIGGEDEKEYKNYLAGLDLEYRDTVYNGFLMLERFFKTRDKSLLNSALVNFQKSSSVYAVNGVAIVLIFKRKYKRAIGILSKNSKEIPLVHINMGNAYVLLEKYKEAIECYKKVPLCNYTKEMIELLSAFEVK